MESLIGINTDGIRTINYDYKTGINDKNIAYATIKDLTIEQIEEIEKATFEEVQKILCNYI